MKVKQINIIFLILACSCITGYSQTITSEKPTAQYFNNPILSGMNPDPSICRAGDDYYLVTSTFGFYPGIPVYHSRDLVNWQLIGYGIHRPSQLNTKANERLNIFAATIRYNNGVFYIISTQTGKGGDRNFVITATNPAGPWSDAHCIPKAERIDPSLFFDDDGKVYYTGNDIPKHPVAEKERMIWMQEMDIENWKLTGEKVEVIQCSDYYRGLILTGQNSDYLNNFEGPHLYKKDGIYYLLVSHGGTSWGHAVSIWKSDKVFGPYEMYEKNPIVTHRDYPHNVSIHHTGHADLVQTQNNEWWMVLLGSRPYGGEYTNLGRETFLVPVDWSGKWPVVNPNGPAGRVLDTHLKPNLPAHTWPKEERRDEFKDKKLKLCWNFIQTPVEQWWKLDKPDGCLRIYLRPEVITERVNPSFIGRRLAHKNFTSIAKMTFTPKVENECAGLIITRDVSNQFQVVCTAKEGHKLIQLIRKEVINENGELRNEKNETIDGKNAETLLAEKRVTSSTLFLKMEAREQMFSFSFSENDTNWVKLADEVDGRMLSFGLGIGKYTGTYVGMYASSNGKESKNSALFDWFEYEGF